jgi:cell division protein FtsN
MIQTSHHSKKSGITLFGVVLGIIIGLAVAIAVALYIARAPSPDTMRPVIPEKTHPAPQTGATRSSPSFDLSEFEEPRIVEVPPASESTQRTTPLPESQTSSKPLPKHFPTRPLQTPSHRNPSAGYYLQAGAYRTAEGAEQQRAHLALQGIESTVSQRVNRGLLYFRVRVGPFAQLEEMNTMREKLADIGVDVIVIHSNHSAH